MRFLADECCTAELVEHLRNDGHDVLYVLEYNRGATDSTVLKKAYQDDRILITEDKDFGELVYRLNKKVKGIILLRFSAGERNILWPRLKELLVLKGDDLIGKFTVVDKEKFRIRPIVQEG